MVGFDDNPLAQRMRPALTTVRQDVAAKGRRGDRGADRGDQPAGSRAQPARVRHVLLPTELVVRDSTAPPPGRR